MNQPNELFRPATRREALAFAAGFGIAAVASPLAVAAPAEPGAAILSRPIPSTGELLPAVGLGTAHEFGRGDDPVHRAESVVRTLIAGGGSVIDTASTYGPSETVLGTILAETGLRPRIFIATKLEEEELTHADLRQDSLRRLHTDRIDLMQLHNVSRAAQSLAPLREWKAQGLVRYIGITTSEDRDFAAVEAVLRREKPDFLQVNYWLTDREAEKRLLPAAAELGVGGIDQHALRRWPPVPGGARQGAARLGQRFRCSELGSVLPQIPARQPDGHGGHSGDFEPGAYE